MNEQKIEGNDEELEALKEMLQDNTQLITALARLAVRYVEED